jgi:hypothetical protein
VRSASSRVSNHEAPPVAYILRDARVAGSSEAVNHCVRI